MNEKKIEKAAQVVADKARQEKITVSDLFYRLMEKSDKVSDVGSDVILRACEILEKGKK
jgi:hypothetical protein